MASGWFGSLAREPLVHFVLLGGLLWSALDLRHTDSQRYLIRIDRAREQRIAESYTRQFGHRPDAAELQQLLKRYIRDEIFLREGLALDLARDDEIVRRRVVQKYEFLQLDTTVAPTPTEAVLEHWYQQNAQRYQIPETVSFTHRFFSVSDTTDAIARERARAALQVLQTSGGGSLGDVFPGPYEVKNVSAPQVNRLFGQSELSAQLFQLPAGQWSGPYRSAYGWHLVQVIGHAPAQLPSFAERRDEVLDDYLAQRRRELNEQQFRQLLSHYVVQYDRSPR